MAEHASCEAVLVGLSTLVLSGSLWFVLPTVYLVASTLRSARREDELLARALPGYAAYRQTTRWMMPWVV